MKKKIFATLLVATLALSMAACGGGETKETNSDVAAATNVSTTKEETAEVTIEEKELYNQNGIVITATSLEMNGSFGPEIKVLVENNSEKNVTVQARSSSINGYMMDFSFSCDVAAGKKANGALSLMSSDLEACGIETIADIEFSFYIFDTDTWDTIANSDVITISTSASGSYEQEYDNSGDVIYDNNGIRIISKGLAEDELYGPELSLYIENNSDQNITVQPRDTSINGFMVEPVLSPEIVPGKKILTGMTFFSSDLESNGITDIETIETSFHIYYTDTWDILEDTAPITISFK